MADDLDFSLLPVEEKIVHKVWKARLEGYNSLAETFALSRNESDACFALFNQKPDILKGFVTDTNVVAQELGILALARFLEYGGTSNNANRLKNAGVIASLCEKGLSSNRAGTRAKATDAILLFVELLDSADPVVEQIVPFFDHRLPKLVAGCVSAVVAIVDAYGCNVASPQMIVPTFAKLFGHADRNVRAEATKLAVEMYKWLREGIKTLLFPTLKPVQQRDLTAEFEKVKDVVAEQKRLTRAQQEAQKEAVTSSNADVEMEDVEVAPLQPQFDPFDMVEPVDVLSKLPSDLATRMASSLWKDRKEALDEVYEVLSKAIKLAPDNYTDLVRIFAKCMKDANIQVVQLAANGVEFLSKGLKDDFQRYQNLVVGPMIERSKEKKPAVADALANALDSIYLNSLLADVLDEILAGMNHKTPQVKINITNYLQRCLASATVSPTSSQIDAIMPIGVKLLTDSQEPIRQAATEMIGTLMKITGERELKNFLENVDDNRMSKVKAVFDKVTVKCTLTRKPAKAPSAAVKGRTPALGNSTPALKKPSTPAIPSKRLATSPAKRGDLAPKVGSTAKSFTGRLLIQPTSNTLSREVPSVDRAELEALRKENAALKSQNETLQKTQLSINEDRMRDQHELSNLRNQIETFSKERENSALMAKQKDAQILRLNTDLEDARLKSKSLEQTIEMMKLQQSTSQKEILHLPFRNPSGRISPFRSPERLALARITLTELSSRVNRLSIDGVTIENETTGATESLQETTSPRRAVTDRTNDYHSVRGKESSEEDNWRKAAEVTAQLKARIEKMKQRNRLSHNR